MVRSDSHIYLWPALVRPLLTRIKDYTHTQWLNSEKSLCVKLCVSSLTGDLYWMKSLSLFSLISSLLLIL